MSHLVGNPEDRFSRDEAHLSPVKRKSVFWVAWFIRARGYKAFFMLNPIAGILTIISRTNDWLWRYTPEIFIEFGCCSIYEQFKFHAQLS